MFINQENIMTKCSEWLMKLFASSSANRTLRPIDCFKYECTASSALGLAGYHLDNVSTEQQGLENKRVRSGLLVKCRHTDLKSVITKWWVPD